jgi:hypothetical protein
MAQSNIEPLSDPVQKGASRSEHPNPSPLSRFSAITEAGTARPVSARSSTCADSRFLACFLAGFAQTVLRR